ncbi:MAG: iron-binding protein [Parcubacteria group bacterium]|nr:MAG: iron-binding protein [Parcubacteria group bacterium]
MARIVKKTAHGPQELKMGDKNVSICMCGLSKNQPFCDGSHKRTLDEKEGVTYCYHDDGSREELK